MQYRDGQVYLAQASTLVEGQGGTRFTEFVKPNDRLFIRDESVSYVIDEVISNERLRLSAPYRRTSKLTDYSIQLDYSAHFRLMMPYLGDFNVEDMMRLNIGKLDALLHAACSGGAAAQVYTLRVVQVSTGAATVTNGRVVGVQISRSHDQPTRINIRLNNVLKIDNAPVDGNYYSAVFNDLEPGEYTVVAEVRDQKGNTDSRSTQFNIAAEGGSTTAPTQPNGGTWTFVPALRAAGYVISSENNVVVGLELTHAGAVQAAWSNLKTAVAVPTGLFQASHAIDFPDYPVKLKIWNLSRQEVWRWDDATTLPVLENAGVLNAGAGQFVVTAVPATAQQQTGDNYLTGWSVLGGEAGASVDVALTYWEKTVNWYHPRLTLDQTTPSVSGAHWSGEASSAAFPLIYEFKNTTKTVTLTYPDATSPATLNEQIHAVTTPPDAIVAIDSIQQVANSQDATLVFRALSNHASLATEWQVWVDGTAVTAWTPVPFNTATTVTHTLASLDVGARQIEVRGRGATVTGNRKTTGIDIASSAVVIAAPVVSNFTVTPGQGSAVFTLDVADTRPVEYRIFRDGAEVFHSAAAAQMTRINQTVANLPAGAASFYVLVTNDAHRQTASEHKTDTIAAPDAGAATITNFTASVVADPAAGERVGLSALVDVPDASGGVHYRFYRYLTAGAAPADDPSLRGGFEWVQQPADNAPVEVTASFLHDANDYTYALDAKPQNGETFSTVTRAVAGGANTQGITIQITATSTIDATSYTIAATASNTAAEAQEYRILEGGAEKVPWTALANNASFTQTIPASAGAHQPVIEVRTANIPVTSKTLSIVVNAAAVGGATTVNPGSNATHGNLKITLNTIDWTPDPVVIHYTPEVLAANAGETVWVAARPQWTTNYGTFYERTATVATQNSFSGMGVGDRVSLRFELRDANNAVLASIDTIDLIKP